MATFTQDQWLIIALVFFLGILVGAFMTAGGRKKWKTRYYDEQKRLKDRELEFNERERDWAAQEREWRERDSLRGAAVRDRDRDGIRDDRDLRDDRDRDRDGIRDDRDLRDDRDRDRDRDRP